MSGQQTDVTAFRQQELENCTFVKTILMLLVIAYHSIVFWGGDWFVGECALQAPFLGVLADWLNTILIQGFVFTSGYIFAYLKYEKGRYTAFGPFVASKAMRLLVPYVFVAAVWVIPIGWAFYRYTAIRVVEQYLLVTAPSQLWSLWMLFDVFIVCWLLAGVFKKHDVLGMLIALLFYAVGIVGQKLTPDYFMIWKACAFLPLFYFGMKYRQKAYTPLRKIPSVVWAVVHVLLFVLVRYGLTGEGAVMSVLRIVGTFLIGVFGALTAFFVLQSVARLVPMWKDNAALSLLGRHAMPMYLFHQQIVYVLVYCLNGLINPYLHGVINWIGATVLSLLLSVVLMKCKVTRWLIGEKS